MKHRKPPRPESGQPKPSGETETLGREHWEPPTLTEMPPLTELTLQTGGPIGGGGNTGGGGSTVF